MLCLLLPRQLTGCSLRCFHMEIPSYHIDAIVKDKNEILDFEGPLSLILLLLQKNKIEIRDLNISDLTDQYVAWLKDMQEMDLEIASDFVQMASHLLYLKSRTLLTSEEEVSELEKLMQSLEQMQFKDRFTALNTVVPQLKTASEKGLLYYSKGQEPIRDQNKEYEYRHDPVDLLKAMLSVWSKGGALTSEQEAQLYSSVPKHIVYSVREKGREIIHALRSGKKTLSSFYVQCRSGSEIVATFLAVLELCSSGSLMLSHEKSTVYVSVLDNRPENALESLEDEL